MRTFAAAGIVVAMASAALAQAPAGGGAPGANATPEQRFAALDKNHDGAITKDEWGDRSPAGWDRLDGDKDGKITLEEFKTLLPASRGGAGGGAGAQGQGGPGRGGPG